MKKGIILIAVFVVCVFFQSHGQNFIKPSGNVITKEYNFTDFTALDISNDFKAYVTFTEDEKKVNIKADDNLHDHIVVRMNGNTLEIRFKNNFNIRGKETLKAYISVSTIHDFRVAGDSKVYLENKLVTNNLKVKLSGDSRFEGDLEVRNLAVDLKGDSYMEVSGKTHVLKGTVKGDSKIEKYSLVIDRLDINLSGDSEAYLTVNESINVKASGDSKLSYQGDAVVNSKKITGDSELEKVD